MKRTVEAFQSFVNPFHLEISHQMTSLYSAAMPEEVRHDVLNALKKGKAKKKVFIRDRLITKKSRFFTLSKGTSSRRWLPPHLKKAYRIESEGDPVQGHKWVHLLDLRQVASPRAASKHLRSDDISSPHSDAIFNGDYRWVLCENQQSARDELPDQRC